MKTNYCLSLEMLDSIILDYSNEIDTVLLSDRNIGEKFGNGLCRYGCYTIVDYNQQLLFDCFIRDYNPNRKNGNPYWYHSYWQIGIKALILRRDRLMLIKKSIYEKNVFVRLWSKLKLKLD